MKVKVNIKCKKQENNNYLCFLYDLNGKMILNGVGADEYVYSVSNPMDSITKLIDEFEEDNPSIEAIINNIIIVQ